VTGARLSPGTAGHNRTVPPTPAVRPAIGRLVPIVLAVGVGFGLRAPPDAALRHGTGGREG
jgi:hypothetical protein